MASAISAKIIRIDPLFPVLAQTVTVNGASVDLKGTVNPGVQEHRVRININTVTGTSPTLVAKMQDSPDNATFTDIAGATTGTLTAAGITEFYFRTANRYVRMVLTLGGTSPSFLMVVDLFSGLRVA